MWDPQSPPYSIRGTASPGCGTRDSSSSIRRSPRAWMRSARMVWLLIDAGPSWTRGRLDDGGHAAVDEDQLAVDEIRGTGSQPDRGAGQVGGSAPAAGRRPVHHPGAQLRVLEQGRVQIGIDVAGSEPVDLDAVGGPVSAHDLPESA